MTEQEIMQVLEDIDNGVYDYDQQQVLDADFWESDLYDIA